MSFNKMMEEHMLKQELDMLDTMYEHQQQALSQLYKMMRTEAHERYGVEEPKPEPVTVDMDADIADKTDGSPAPDRQNHFVPG